MSDADCEMIGKLAAEAEKRRSVRLRANELQRLAEEVWAEVVGVQTSDAEFLARLADICRRLAAIVSNAQIRDELIALADDMEKASDAREGPVELP